MQVFDDLHANCEFERSLNATFTILILKKLRVVDVRDSVSIRLVSGVYKIIYVVLTSRNVR